MNGSPMPGTGTTGIREYVENELSGTASSGETPEDILRILYTSVDRARELVQLVRKSVPPEYLDGDLLCTLLDIEAWCELGEYYHCKFSAALELAFFERSAESDRKENAVVMLQKGLEAWKKLSAIWTSHYMPYKMVRSKYIFGWSYYTNEVEREIRLARNFSPLSE